MSRDPQQKKPKGEGPVGNIISDPVLLERYVAIADYVKQETNQCSLEAGQVVEVVEKNQHGGWVWPAWWVGVASMVGGCGQHGAWVWPVWWVDVASMVGGCGQHGGWVWPEWWVGVAY